MSEEQEKERFTLYVTPDFKARLVQEAEKDERSISNEVIWIVKQYLAEKDKKA